MLKPLIFGRSAGKDKNYSPFPVNPANFRLA
jgi:hypothetical protein